jgi:Domain of unknown function (DUF1707)/Cell wall-active antibiotics response 4TMS YvqF
MPDNSCMDPQPFNENSRLRASDADRDQAADVINSALAEGRLTAEEHSDRLDAIYSAKTHAELVPLLDDLPAKPTQMAPTAMTEAGVARSGRHGSHIAAIFGGASRKGPWHVDPHMRVTTIMGGVELDFREAVLPGKEVTIYARTILGGLEITVPPEMRVIDSGITILGGREITGDSPESAHPDAPLLRVEGPCVLGGVEVRRRKRKGSKSSRSINVQMPVLRITTGDDE